MSRTPQLGRVIDIRQAANGFALAVLAEDRLVMASVTQEIGASLTVGDLVRIEGTGHETTVARVGGPTAGEWNALGDGLRWRLPTAPTSRIRRLKERSAICRAIREYLHSEDFVELQAPSLVVGTCPDAAIDSIDLGVGQYLTTSTEYHIKRLLVGGLERVYTLGPNFRAGDFDRTHNPEFTMLEWGRALSSIDEIEADAEAFTREAARAIGALGDTGAFNIPESPWRRIALRDALLEVLDVRLAPDFSAESMRAEIARHGFDLPPSFLADRGLMLSYLVDHMQPRLGEREPVFVRGWPAFQTSSAASGPGQKAETLRSELFMAGLEVADGFAAVTDPAAQERHFEEQQVERARRGKAPVALDQRYLDALRQGMPPAAGMALGVDRLVMALTGATDIREVIGFAWDER